MRLCPTSTNKGEMITSWFKNRNTILHIWSQTGRHIREFSNFQEKEDEILLAPGTELLCCKKKIINGKLHIWFREIKSGLTDYSVIWVDDHLLDNSSADN